MTDGPRRLRAGSAVRAALFVATLSLGIGLAAIPVSTWMDQRDELDDARQRRDELEVEISEIEADIAWVVGDEGFEIAARCYGPYVEPGTELYAVPGLQGCVVDSAP